MLSGWQEISASLPTGTKIWQPQYRQRPYNDKYSVCRHCLAEYACLEVLRVSDSLARVARVNAVAGEQAQGGGQQTRVVVEDGCQQRDQQASLQLRLMCMP